VGVVAGEGRAGRVAGGTGRGPAGAAEPAAVGRPGGGDRRCEGIAGGVPAVAGGGRGESATGPATRPRGRSPERDSFLHQAAQVPISTAAFSRVRVSLAWTHRRTRRWVRTQAGRHAGPPPRLVRLANRRSTSDRSRRSRLANAGDGPSVSAIDRSRPGARSRCPVPFAGPYRPGVTSCRPPWASHTRCSLF